MRRIGATLRKKFPRSIKQIKFDPRKVRLETVSENSAWFTWGLTLFAVLLASFLSAQIIGIWIRPKYQPLPPKRMAFTKPPGPSEDYSVIEQRNIFDVENKIPAPYDQSLLDCFSQARPSTQRISLLGTIVMGDDKLSVALIQEDGKGDKIGVRKDEIFFDRFQAMKIDRKKLCFQVKASQEFEFIEIPDDGIGMAVGSGPSLGFSKAGGGITPTSATTFVIKPDYLANQLKDLNNVLQTAKAVPYQDQSGKMKGFLIQTIEPDSPFASLGLNQGDVLTGVNDIVLDNMGRGLEAFNRLRNSNRIDLKIIRNGQEMNLGYDVK